MGLLPPRRAGGGWAVGGRGEVFIAFYHAPCEGTWVEMSWTIDERDRPRRYTPPETPTDHEREGYRL